MTRKLTLAAAAIAAVKRFDAGEALVMFAACLVVIASLRPAPAIMHPAGEARALAAASAGGDLTRVIRTHGNDELGQLAPQLAGMAGNFKT